MESLGDPILDIQEICKQSPVDKETLEKAYNELGWDVPLDEVLESAMDVYVTLGDDGLYHYRNGTALEIISKILKGKQ